MSLTTLKWAAILCFIVAMAILLGGGIAMKKELPPYPGKVVGPGGNLLFEKADIMAGQDVYQRYGLMDQGAVWGHGSQRGPEFSAASLHIMAEAIGDYFAQKDYGKPYNDLDDLQKGIIDVKTTHEIKPNRYDAAKDTLTLTAAQVEGLKRVKQHWGKIFKEGEQRYGFLPDTIRTEEQRLQISRFFFWTAWVASTLRPGTDYTYTNNWPPDKRVGNTASTETYFYSIAGIVALLLVLGLFVYWIHRYGLWYGAPKGVALSEKLIDMPLTPSQLQAAKFFVVVIMLFLLQTTMGELLAHYTIHPGSFFLPFVAKLIPYNWAKTWHLQLMVFWIATTWMASAIYLAPIIGGKEPAKQGLLVQLLFGAVLLVAVGSLTGEVLGIKGLLGNMWFWLGHQGWEFLELGCIWQILLFVGLIFWLVVVYRAVGNHLKSHKDDFSALIWFYVFSAVLVVAFFWNFLGAGIFGFVINLPIINFYEHGTYLTMHHGHTAMFGTYGMLSVALLLFSWRGLVDKAHWKDGILKLSFWGLNGGLFLMAFVTLLPVGAMQAWISFKEGYWVARSADFFEKGAVVWLGTFRALPDTIIIVLGVLSLAYFLITTYPHLKAVEIKDGESVWERLGIEL